ncbi:NAD(P)-binding protein [Trichoderma evansii]
MSSDFKGKLAIVTGASKLNGIGYATAYLLAKGGADVVISYNSNKNAVQEVVAKLKELGVQIVAVQGNAGSLTFGDDIINATVAAFPGRNIDIIINNAGHATFPGTALDSPIEEFDAIFHPNVRGPHLLIRAALPHLTSPGGRIVNVGTAVARTGSNVATFYTASKGALNTLTLAWAEELGEKGITVNVVAPGPTATDYAPPEDFDLTRKFRAQQYIKRNGTPEEVASAIVFAVSPGASFMSGQVIGIDGGLTYV